MPSGDPFNRSCHSIGGGAAAAIPVEALSWRIRSASRVLLDKRYACGEPPTDERPWPLGFWLIGCLLMLVQFPIWFRLFRLLRSFIVRCHIQIVRREEADPPVSRIGAASSTPASDGHHLLRRFIPLPYPQGGFPGGAGGIRTLDPLHAMQAQAVFGRSMCMGVFGVSPATD